MTFAGKVNKPWMAILEGTMKTIGLTVMLMLGVVTIYPADASASTPTALKQDQHQVVVSDSVAKTDQVPGPKQVRGEVLKMENNSYLVRDESGKEVRLIVNKDSKVEKAFEVGDWVLAHVSDDGTVTVITKFSEARSPEDKKENKK
jgi:exosome complex RNA-binding protein Csl4